MHAIKHVHHIPFDIVDVIITGDLCNCSYTQQMGVSTIASIKGKIMARAHKMLPAYDCCGKMTLFVNILNKFKIDTQDEEDINMMNSIFYQPKPLDLTLFVTNKAIMHTMGMYFYK